MKNINSRITKKSSKCCSYACTYVHTPGYIRCYVYPAMFYLINNYRAKIPEILLNAVLKINLSLHVLSLCTAFIPVHSIKS